MLSLAYWTIEHCLSCLIQTELIAERENSLRVVSANQNRRQAAEDLVKDQFKIEGPVESASQKR